MRHQRWLVGVAVAMVALGTWSAAASAHVTPDPPSAPKGAGDQVITFRVPNEMTKANTVSLTLQLPQDHPIAAVDVLAMPGWTSKVEIRHLTTPIKTDDGSFSDVASVITWTGGKIAPGQYGEFKILAMGLPKDTDSLTFKALQGYDNGQSVDWIDTQANADHPAPVIKLVAGTDASATPTPTTAAPAATPAVSKSSSSNSSKGIAVAALIAGIVALLVALGAFVTGRRPSTPAT